MHVVHALHLLLPSQFGGHRKLQHFPTTERQNYTDTMEQVPRERELAFHFGQDEACGQS